MTSCEAYFFGPEECCLLWGTCFKWPFNWTTCVGNFSLSAGNLKRKQIKWAFRS